METSPRNEEAQAQPLSAVDKLRLAVGTAGVVEAAYEVAVHANSHSLPLETRALIAVGGVAILQAMPIYRDMTIGRKSLDN